MSSEYNLSKEEMETIILWDEKQDTATVYTHDLRMINKLTALSEKYPASFILTEQSSHRSVTYTVPKRCVGIRPPYSEERKQEQRQTAAENGLPFSLCNDNSSRDGQMQRHSAPEQLENPEPADLPIGTG